MSYQHSPYECTSANFEKAALNRFRSLAPFVPETCQIFREPWDCSTVLCLDFVRCPDRLERVKSLTQDLVSAIQELGLSHGVIFRIGHKFMGWMTITASRES